MGFLSMRGPACLGTCHFSALIAAILGLAVLGKMPAGAQPLGAQETSVQARVDSFVSYLKAEMNEALTAAARLARENKDSLASAKAYLESQYDGWRLSYQKAGVTTLGKGAAAFWEAWTATAASSWASIEHHAHDALDWIEAWMRNQSSSNQYPETPV
jgi:hypothetical protein